MLEIEADVTIIGAGLVGLVAAHALKNLKYKVAIIDKKKFKDLDSNGDNRTVAISEGSKQFLEKLYLWKSIEEHSEPIKNIIVYDRTPSNKTSFQNEAKNESLGYIVENSKLNKILKNKILGNKKVSLYYNSKILDIENNNQYGKVFLEDKTIKSKLIIAADGKNSSIAKMIGSNAYKKIYPEKALVLNFFHEKKLNNTAYEIFYKDGPLAILPMKESKGLFRSSLIWTNKKKYNDKLINSSDLFIKNIIEEKILNITGKITKINSKQNFPLSAHLNDKFYNNKVIYVGDSAHSIHPIAGQGWNLGIKDIKNLYLICCNLHENKSDIGNGSFCKKFNEMSYKNAFELYQITDKLHLHFKRNGLLNKAFSNVGFNLIENNKKIKNYLTKYAMGF